MPDIPFNRNSILLAPMAGVSDSGFRRICRKYGADCTVSEMISSKGLFYNDKKTKQLLYYTREEEPFIIQIFGSDGGCMSHAAKYISCNYSPAAIDINMGCPAPKIFQNGDGCALMKDLKKAYNIIKSVREATDLPVGVKFRSGIDSEHINAVEFAQMCESAGADYITVHGRTREQFYSGKSNAEIIRQVVKNVTVPVIANGDISDAESAESILNYTGAHSIMIGRAALGNPIIFNKIKAGLSIESDTKQTPDIFTVAAQHLDYTIEDKGELQAVREFRKHLIYYLKGVKNSAKLKQMSCTAVTKSDCLKIFELAQNNI